MTDPAVQAANARTDSANGAGTSSSSPTRLDHETQQRALRAARYAAAAHPGAVGEVLSEAIHAYVAQDQPLSPAALAPRLVSAMQRAELDHPLPPLRSASGNLYAARYVPGSPMHWRHPTAADEPEE